MVITSFGTVMHKWSQIGIEGESEWKTGILPENERVVGYFGRSIIKRNRWQGSREAEPRAGMVFRAIDPV